jgi:uracil-DNA glycosylase
MFGWFARLGVEEEDFRRRVFIAATIRCFPGRAPQGGDRVPAPDELRRCRPYLERELELLRPLTVVAVGQLAIGCFLPDPAPLDERIGQQFTLQRAGWSYELVPLPHPSGRSTWTNRPENAALLDRALELIAESRGWRATFAPGK